MALRVPKEWTEIAVFEAMPYIMIDRATYNDALSSCKIRRNLQGEFTFLVVECGWSPPLVGHGRQSCEGLTAILHGTETSVADVSQVTA